MLVRTKSGEFAIRQQSVLLDFLRGELGLRMSEGGIKGVNDGLDVELIAPVPFCLSAEGEDNNAVRAIPWTFSTFDLDRFDERIDPAGWDFRRFLDNPVVEWAHCYDIPAIGKAEGIHADEQGLHGSIVFNDKSFDPFGWAIGERVKAGVIRAGSVGFRVLEIELPDKAASMPIQNATHSGKYSRTPSVASGDGTSLIFRKQELLEFSVCNVPANPFALTKQGAERKAAKGFPHFWGNIINNFEE